ncbi:MAG: DUF5674 family protein [Elusimicrobiota bacterium]
MKVITVPVEKKEILEKYNNFYENMIKADVDIEKEIIALDAELHADLEQLLIEQGSELKDIWGINLYMDKEKEEQIEYVSLINIKPALGNSSMEIKHTA